MAGLAKCIIISLYFRLDVECMELEAITVVWCIYNCNCYSEHILSKKTCMHAWFPTFFFYYPMWHWFCPEWNTDTHKTFEDN